MIELRNISMTVGGFSLSNISFRVENGEHVALMGRTGCGKTTLLEAICGLKPVDSGSILIRDRDLTRARPGERNVGYVPQDLALFPTLTVSEHLGLALEARGWDSVDCRKRIDELAGLLGIGDLLHRHPAGLSGGEGQRVSIGRALSYHPDVLCLDEPFSALDEDTLMEMFELIERIRSNGNTTVLHVTHSRDQVNRLGDRVLSIVDGTILEEETA